MIIVLMGREKKNTCIVLYILFFLAVSAHISHPFLMMSTLFFLFLLRGVYAEKTQPVNKRIAILFILSVVSFLTMLTPVHKSKHVFLMASLTEKKVLVTYLNDNCATQNFKICQYKDALPSSFDAFLWDNNSPLYKTGTWKETKPEFDSIIHGIFSHAVYLKLFFAATARESIAQMLKFNIGDGNQSFDTGRYQNKVIQKYFPRESAAFNNSRQNKTDMLEAMDLPNEALTIIICISLLVLVYAVTGWRHMPDAFKLVLLAGFTGIVLNCIDCAAFSTVNGRYGCKMMWMFPFCTLLFAMMKRDAKKQGT